MLKTSKLAESGAILAIFGAISALSLGACSSEDQAAVQQNDHNIVLNRPGFAHEQIVGGLSNPTAMVIAPDGRFFVTQQGGDLRVVKNNTLLSTPFLSLNVDDANERGLLGLALDPDFPANGFVYVYYTTPSGGTHNRISRFTANGDVAAPGSEVVLVDLPALSSAANHNAGALHFGHDGKLYVAVGDNANTALAQMLSHPFGSILRFNRDGSIPTDNPFYSAPIDTSDAIWAYGLRNPFTIAVSPASGKLFANDVGGGDPEEINLIQRGRNYGHGGGPDPVAPLYSYDRTNGRCAITGGTFYEPSVVNFPSEYVGKYFFADYCGSEIWIMNQDGSGVQSFASASNGELNNPVDIDVGLDGSLYYLQRGNGAKIGRIFVDQPNCNTDSDCNDNNVCNGVETCQGGTCQTGSALNCGDGDPCTADSCNPATGCQNPDNGLCDCSSDVDCDDGDSCTSDSCVGQMCQNSQNGTCSAARLEVENYSAYSNPGAGGEDAGRGGDAGFENCVDNSGCGYNIGWIDAGDSIEWTYVAPTTGTYSLSSRLATTGDNSVQNILVDGALVATVQQPTATGGWQNWVTATSSAFSMSAGAHTIRIDFVTTGQNLNYIEIFAQGGSTCGNGACGAGEDCSSCPADCGVCAGNCGNNVCDGGETCNSCPGDCGSCGGGGALSLTYVSDDGGWNNVAGLTDGDLEAKVTSGVSPNCIRYSLGGAKTISSARLLEDNAGGWNVGTWKLQYSTGAGFSDAIGYTDTPVAMPGWNEIDFPDISGVTELKVCLQNNGSLEAAEIQVFGEEAGTGSFCGDAVCQSGESCGSCAADCGPCGETGPLTLNHVGDGGGWSNVGGLVDGDLNGKVSTGVSPNCVEYDLGGASTIRSARLLEDNAGGWNVESWKVQYSTGGGFVDATGYQPTPQAMPVWNEIDFPDVAGVTRVKICLQNTGGPIEAAEVQVIGDSGNSGGTCGDRVCSPNETCSSCPWDCNTCESGVLGLDARPSNSACVAGDSSASPPALLSQSPCVVSVGSPPVFSSGVLPYTINQAFWSDGGEKSRFFALPDGTAFTVEGDGDFVLPPGGVTVKHFAWNGQNFETRFFVRYNDGSYGAWTYKWNDAQTEAELVDPVFGDSKILADGHVWNYPYESQCFDCHTSAAGFSLGLEARQLNLDMFYPETGRTANQYDTLAALGYLSGQTQALPPLPSLSDTSPDIEMRAEAYLHVNCAHCHRPGGTGQGNADYRYDTPLSQMNICNESSILGAYSGLDLVEPGDADTSVVWLRASTRGQNQMPPIATTIVDTTGVGLLEAWINGLTSCP